MMLSPAGHGPATTLHRHPAALAVAALLLTALFAGCAAKPPRQQPAAPVTWTLTEDGAAAYFYLVFLDEAQAGRFLQAEAALDRAIELDPSPRLYLEAAEFQWRLGRPARAREYIKQALDKDPGDRLMVMRLADSYVAERRYDDALTTLSLFLQKNPGDMTALLRSTDIQIEARRYGEALQTLAGIPARDRGPEALYLEAKANAGLGKRRKAIEILKRLATDNPESVLYVAELAYQYELAKDYVAAEEAYTRILEMEDAGEEVWLRLVSINLKLNNPERAMSLAQEGPPSSDFLMEAARTFLAEGFPDEAAQLLQPLTQDPNADPKLYFYLALLAYDGQKDAAKAMEYLDKIPAASELSGRAAAFRAHMLFVLGQKDEAYRLTQEGKRDYPEIKDFWEIESWIAEDRGQFDEARSVIAQALSLWPDEPGLLYRLGVLQHKMGDDDAAITTMERIIVQDPEHAEALNFVGYLLADLGRDLDRALVLVQQALAQKPDSGHIIDSLAWVHFRMGKLDAAWENIRQAVELSPDDPTMWEHYGDIAAALGKRTEARKGWRRSLELKPDDPGRIQRKLDGPKGGAERK